MKDRDEKLRKRRGQSSSEDVKPKRVFQKVVPMNSDLQGLKEDWIEDLLVMLLEDHLQDLSISRSCSLGGRENLSLWHIQCPHCGWNHLGECWKLQGVCFYCKEPRHMKRDCPKLGGKGTSSQPSVGQKEKTQTNAAPQPSIVGVRTGVQTQAGSSSEPRQSGYPGRPRVATRV